MNKSSLLITESGNTTNKNIQNSNNNINSSKNEASDTTSQQSSNSKYVRPKSLNYENITVTSKEQLIYSNRSKFFKQNSIPSSTLTANTAANRNLDFSHTSSKVNKSFDRGGGGGGARPPFKYQLSANESFNSKLCVIDKQSELECKKKNANFKDHLKQVKKAKAKKQKTRNNEAKIDEEEETPIQNNNNNNNTSGDDDEDEENSDDEDDNDEDETESLLYPAYVPVALKYIF